MYINKKWNVFRYLKLQIIEKQKQTVLQHKCLNLDM